MASTAGRGKQTLAIAGTVMLAATMLGLAVFSSNEALEERRVAAEAVDIQLATLTVAMADAGMASDPTIEPDELLASVNRLERSGSLEIHGLDPAEQAEVNSLLAEIVATGNEILTSGQELDGSRNYQRLESLLSASATHATTAATTAEHKRAVFLILLAACLMATAWQVVQARLDAARRQAAADVELHAGRRLQRLLNDSPDIFLVLSGGRLTYRSASAVRLLDPSANSFEDLLNSAAEPDKSSLADHLGLPMAGGVSRTFELTDRSGRNGWFEIRVSDLTTDELVNGYLITARDVTNEVHLRHDLFAQANTDVLTGLPNRRVLDRVLDEASATITRSGGSTALVSLDLDGFKEVNDTLGHAAGDELLTQVAERLQKVSRPGDVLLRLGGDEFAVLLPSLADGADAEQVAERYLGVLDKPIQLRARLEQLRASIGVAVTDDPSHVSSLVSEADMAMYTAKRAGGSRIALFEPVMEDDTLTSSRLSRALRLADYDTEFSVVYQPIVAVATGRLVGLEALIRWYSPVLGQQVPPDEFIPVAERSGDIRPIGQWVLETVCRQIRAWDDAGSLDPILSVSCNVSPVQLSEPNFVSGALATLATWQVPTSRITVEVTESAVLDHAGIAVTRLNEIRAAGVRISIDDFGSGYSNLGQLLRVPFDVLKIDRSLLLTLSEMRTAGGGDPSEACAIMEAIVSIASVFQAPVICEGVETEMQLLSLGASGVTHVQGYLTGRPVPADQLDEMLARGYGAGSVAASAAG